MAGDGGGPEMVFITTVALLLPIHSAALRFIAAISSLQCVSGTNRRSSVGILVVLAMCVVGLAACTASVLGLFRWWAAVVGGFVVSVMISGRRSRFFITMFVASLGALTASIAIALLATDVSVIGGAISAAEGSRIGESVRLDADVASFFSPFDFTRVVSSTVTLSQGLVLLGERPRIEASTIILGQASSVLMMVGEHGLIKSSVIIVAPTQHEHGFLQLHPTTELSNVTIKIEGRPVIANVSCRSAVACEVLQSATFLRMVDLWNSTLPSFARLTPLLHVRMLFPGTVRAIRAALESAAAIGGVAGAWSRKWLLIGGRVALIGASSALCGVVEGAAARSVQCFDRETMHEATYSASFAIAELAASTGLPFVIEQLRFAFEWEWRLVCGMTNAGMSACAALLASPAWLWLVRDLFAPLASFVLSYVFVALCAYGKLSLLILDVQQRLFFAATSQVLVAAWLLLDSFAAALNVAWLTTKVYATTGISVHVTIAIGQTAILGAALWRDIREEAAARSKGAMWLVGIPTMALGLLVARGRQIATYLITHLVAFVLVVGTNFLPSHLLHFASLQCAFPAASVFALLQYFGAEGERRRFATLLAARTAVAIVLQKCVGDIIAFALYEIAKVAVPLAAVMAAVVVARFFGGSGKAGAANKGSTAAAPSPALAQLLTPS